MLACISYNWIHGGYGRKGPKRVFISQRNVAIVTLVISVKWSFQENIETHVISWNIFLDGMGWNSRNAMYLTQCHCFQTKQHVRYWGLISRVVITLEPRRQEWQTFSLTEKTKTKTNSLHVFSLDLDDDRQTVAAASSQTFLFSCSVSLHCDRGLY